MHPKKTKIIIFLILVFVWLTNNACHNIKAAYVNPAELMQGYHGAKAQHEVFQAKARDWQQRIDSLSTELQTLGQVPSATRAAKEQQLLHYREAVQQQAQQENQRLTQAVLAEINTYIKRYGKQHDYTFILGATVSGNIVYADDEANITDDVLNGLNKQYDRQHSTK